MLKIFEFQHKGLHGARWDQLLLAQIPHTLVTSAKEADLVVCPDLTTNDRDKNVEILHALLSIRGKKPTICFHPDDPEDPLPLPYRQDAENLLIYRTSMLRSLQAPYERVYPSFMCCARSAYSPCEMSEKPRIAFVGAGRWPSRLQACVALKKEPSIETKFIFREDTHCRYSPETQALHKLEFETCMQDYPYQLCCRGAVNFSHRFYEVLASGRIPVLVDTSICLPEHVPKALWNRCIVMTENAEDLPRALLAYHAKHNVHSSQLACRSLWENYLSVLSFAKQLELDMENLVKNVTPQAQHLTILEPELAEEKTDNPVLFRAMFGGEDVTDKIPQDGPFKVSIDLFGDPTPNVFKFLHIITHELTTVVSEHDTIHDIYNFDVPASTTMAPLPQFFQGKKGLEIGGPSMYSVRPLGIYTLPRTLDNLHLFDTPGPFRLAGKTITGSTFSGDITQVDDVFPEDSFDFVFASHVLEHVKNPLKALMGIRNVLRKNGHCVLILPFKDVTFDHRRPVTSITELIQHYDQKEDESDVMDHVTPELLKLYDFTRDPEAGTKEQFVERCKNNIQNRCLHIHVFDFQLIYNCLHFADFTPVYAQLVDGHQIVVGKRQY